jgi:hypothetical protein
MDILPSELKRLNDTIWQLRNERDAVRSQTLRNLNRKILEAKWINDEMKAKLLDLIWDKHED